MDSGFWDVLASRRMCRDFRPDPVADDMIEHVLRGAFRGPSAGNAGGLDLVVLRDAQTKRYWDVTLPSAARAGFRWPGLLAAPVLIVPVANPGAYLERYSRSDKAHSGLGAGIEAWSVPYWFVDGGAAVMSMLLCAEAQGLGALFFGQFDHEPAVLAEFGVPESHRALGTIALGHPAPSGRQPSMSASDGRPVWSRHVFRGDWGTPW